MLTIERSLPIAIGLPLLFASAFMMLLFTICGSFGSLALCLAVFILYSLPGHCAMYPLFYREGRLLEGFVWGTISGIAITSLVISVIVYSLGWNMYLISGAIVILPSVLFGRFLLKQKINQHDDIPASPHHRFALFFVLLICVAFFYFPYKNLGLHLNGKYIYTWLFGHDFINRQVHAIVISRGLPMESYYFAGEKVSYYWLAYVFPALLHKLFSTTLSIQSIMQFSSLLYSLFTASALFLFLAHFVKRAKIFFVLLILAFGAYSYMYLYVIARFIYKSALGSAIPLGTYSLDGFAGFSHSLYRFFLVEPQGVLAIAVMLLIILLYNRKSKSLYALLLSGFLLGLLFGIEATMGIILAMWFIATGFLKIAFEQLRRRLIKEHVIACAAAGLAYLCLFAIEMYSMKTGQGVLKLKPNLFSILLGVVYFPLEYGPLMLLGVAGIAEVFKQREKGNHLIFQFLILLAISLFFALFVVNPAESQFGLLKATRIIPLCLLMLTAYLFEHNACTKFKPVIALLIILALPTYFMDIHIASDIKDSKSTYIKEADFKACQWIKENLPAGAIIQAEPNYPGVDPQYNPLYYYSLVPIFAERATGIGEWKVSSVEHGRTDNVRERYHEIRKIFSTTNLSESIEILKKYGIGYIYIGTLEKKLYSTGLCKFQEHQGIFKKVYSGSGVDIYEFSGDKDKRSA